MKSGFTLIELLISLAIISLVIPVIYQVSEGIIFSTTTTTAVNDIKLINQKLIENIKSDVVQSAIIIDNNSSYKDKISISLPPYYVQLDKNRLPTINDTGSFPPQSDYVGNVLFVVKYLSPMELTVESINYRIDNYRFVCYFLVKDTNTKINDKNPIVLMKAESRDIYLNYVAIDSISDNNTKKALVQALYSMNMRYSVDLRNAKFYSLSDNGNISIDNNHRIQMNSNPASRNFGVNQLPTGSIYYAIGYNNIGYMPVPKFANLDNTGDGFPHGFEIAVVGPKSSRDVLVRSVVIACFSGKVLLNESSTIISVPQF